MNTPKLYDVKQAIQRLKYVDYAKIIFSGHGRYSPSHKSTMLALNKDEEIDSAEFRGACRKQTTILDCCRAVANVIPEERRLIRLAEAVAQLNPNACRQYYDERIEMCDQGFIIMYSCSEYEKSYDDSEKGGYYSYKLIESVDTMQIPNSTDILTRNKFFSVAEAHDIAKERVITLSRDNQHPQIEKTKSGPYFPFAVMA
jgi:hypothetical protein